MPDHNAVRRGPPLWLARELVAQVWLNQRGNQRKLSRIVAELAGRTLAANTVSRWARGDKNMTIATVALINLIGRIEQLPPDLQAKLLEEP